jgi:hypothetical protein
MMVSTEHFNISPIHVNHFPKNVKNPIIFASALKGSFDFDLNPSILCESCIADTTKIMVKINTNIIERVVYDIILYGQRKSIYLFNGP